MSADYYVFCKRSGHSWAHYKCMLLLSLLLKVISTSALSFPQFLHRPIWHMSLTLHFLPEYLIFSYLSIISKEIFYHWEHVVCFRQHCIQLEKYKWTKFLKITSVHHDRCTCLASHLLWLKKINPFTAPAGKFSELKSVHANFWAYNKPALKTVHFDVNTSTC